jgi:putative endopeptidase
MTPRTLFLGLLLAVGGSAKADFPSTSGLLPGLDTAVLPGNDFFQYANGGWLKTAEIPSDYSEWGPGVALLKETTRRTSELLEKAAEAPPGTDARKAGDYYASYLDEAAIEAKGLLPLQPDLARIASLSDKKALARLFGEQLRADVDPMNNTNFHTERVLGLWVSPDLNAPSRYAAYLLQGGLGLPERAYYVELSPAMAEVRVKYLAYVVSLLKLAHVPDASAKAARIMALETKLARAHVSREDSEDVLKGNNPWKQTDFPARAPGLDWAAVLSAARLDTQPLVFVWQPAGITGLAALVASEPLATWKDYLTFHAINSRCGVLPRAFVQAHFAFYGKTLFGTPELSPRFDRAVAATNAAVGDAVGQLYVKRYFPPEAKAQVQGMARSIILAFGRRIESLDWMAAATKAKAKEKLSTLYVGVGYPERWVDYAGLEVVRGEALANEERAELFEYRRRLAQLSSPVDLTEWWMTPQTVNAVNMPLQNALNFPAAILQAPFFDPGASSAVNYGSIGATIGHEISHSFDDQGSQFDAHGKLSDWWTPADLAHFQAAGAQLASQFDGYRPFPDLSVNGKQTLSENIADLAGLAAAHDAWLLSLEGKPAPAVESFSGEQAFFLSYAQSWRTKEREASLRQQLITDGHAPAEYRAETVRNLDAWYQAYDVKPGQSLYLAPLARVRLW